MRPTTGVRVVMLGLLVCLMTGPAGEASPDAGRHDAWWPRAPWHPGTLALWDVGSQTSTDIAVVVHPDVPVDDLSLADLRRILLGDREFWPSSVRVTLLIRAPVARERDAVVQGVCKMTEAQFRQHWIGKVFRAETPTGPKIVYSSEMALQQVTRIQGSITFIDSSLAAKGAKVLKIDGRLPGQSGYRVR